MGNLFGGDKKKSATTTKGGKGGKNDTPDKGERKVAKNPDNVLGGYTKDTIPDGYDGKISSGGFLDDGAKRMPSATDAVARENQAILARQIGARSGRESTNLTGGTLLFGAGFDGKKRGAKPVSVKSSTSRAPTRPTGGNRSPANPNAAGTRTYVNNYLGGT